MRTLIDRLITTPLVGVDIGSSILKVVEIAEEDGKIILHRCGVAPVEGENVSAILKQLVAEMGITTTHAALGVASPEVIVKPFEYPRMPRKELLKAIQLEAEQEMLSSRAETDTAIDWHTLSSDSRESHRGLLAVVPKNLLSSHLEIAKESGLHPVIVDVEGLALWNAYWALLGRKEIDPKTILLMNIGAKTTNLVIAKGPDALILIRDLPFGAKALREGQEKEWVNEVRDSLGYAHSHRGLRTLDNVYMTGGGSGRDLKLLLATAAGVPVEFWNPLNNLARTPGLSVEDSVGPLLAVAIGLALRKPT